jgi:hypothetical protein
LSKTASANIK